ncbi:TIGR02757 family protein [Hufsiella ginkgonis]|uniref:TIGR02757 family protein n=1 Tax=Hufsiella ginkgonis TaxID=2695274 RepID=A0A7K1Y0K9_9SPHI|nr:TIGR02757 family protein [Hufsiella ginkgonis]MXV16618.1 TIGR02757 family protein [Hufsiella ginkgonis]
MKLNQVNIPEPASNAERQTSNQESLRLLLDSKVARYNQPGFIENDPIVIPHSFTQKQDIEIMGFFTAILAWGQRKTIINKCRELVARMDGQPYLFITGHQESDLKALPGFKHRTFNDTDLLYFIHFFRNHYQEFDSLEDAFLPGTGPLRSFRDVFMDQGLPESTMLTASGTCDTGEIAVAAKLTVEAALNHFRSYFFSLPDFPRRTMKHISSPLQGSTCKRLNMFLRWMVRKDGNGVDFGIWDRISPAALICPCDLHVDRVARELGLISRKQTDWQTAVELTERLRAFDPDDPVKYDFALFGMGIEEGYGKTTILRPLT